MRKPVIIAVLSLSSFISLPAVADDVAPQGTPPQTEATPSDNPAPQKEIALQDNPPPQYVVVKGDTLWSIASRFLKDPWRWPDVWNLNREQIKNPNRIYPGDMVVLDTSGGSPRLRLVRGTRDETIKLSPYVRSESIEERAIPPIPPSDIEPFLAGPQIIDEDALDHSPYIAGPQEDRYIMGLGDTVYVAGAKNSDVKFWNIYRPGKTLVDPDTKEILGREAEYLGDARTTVSDDVLTATITRSVKEIRSDDRLEPAKAVRAEYLPHAPDVKISGRIVSAYGAVSDVGRYATVVINKGSDDGLEVGHVLAVYRKGRTIPAHEGEPLKNNWRYIDTECVKDGAKVGFEGFYDPKEVLEPCPKKKEEAEKRKVVLFSDIGCLKPGAKVSFDQFFDPKEVYKTHCRQQKRDALDLPDARTGLILVYRVFDKASYALVMSSNRPVYLLDVVKNP